ncbi:endonuclease/exonuclease/phosphatase family protein [uncultured Roseobacter sp.]|uniref:endonuclease/exonuclease/phosphatase family protein n=1 Tax=uncultured Roseobacter sp. TaxID=114847 RepID=UPI002625CBDC|nr:endonuclease/exonuclease/phosphatase family protein [uncultured Roseobacter sp.]
MTQIVGALPRVTAAERARILSAPRTPEANAELMSSIPAMTVLEQGGTPARDVLPRAFTVAAWNVERCLFPAESADHLAQHSPAIVLLSEMDSGMARTAQKNTSAEMAAALGMTYAYGVEFYEMGLGGETERDFCTDDFNVAGWHGNAILSSVPFEKLVLIRLDQKGHWFCTGPQGVGDTGQPRLGGRMAVAAIVPSEAGPLCFVSTHLESNAQAPYRHAEFGRLLAAVDDFAPGLPVLIGGDLNTGNHMPPDFDWRKETLFGLAKEQGYSWDLTAEGITTRASLITPHPTRKMKLDWFASRGVTGEALPVLPSVHASGRPLSDHDCMLCRVTL